QELDGIRLSLRAGATIAGEIFGPDERPDAGRYVKVSGKIDGSYETNHATSDARGHFEGHDLAGGGSEASATEGTGLDPETKATVTDGGVGHVRLAPPDSGLIRVHGQVHVSAPALSEIDVTAQRQDSEAGQSRTHGENGGSYELTVPGG